MEDVDFSGARGVLVNITAGPDMSIGEFEAVGDAVKSFASETATVVVGTVIDEELKDELRVTVVVTGLNDPGTQTINHQETARQTTRNDGTVDYNQLDRPAFQRHSAPRTTAAPKSAAAPKAEAADSARDIDILDIPAFLRKQED